MKATRANMEKVAKKHGKPLPELGVVLFSTTTGESFEADPTQCPAKTPHAVLRDQHNRPLFLVRKVGALTQINADGSFETPNQESDHDEHELS